jgi:hypothetical protein
MAKLRGTVNIDVADSTPDWTLYTQSIAPEGAPNVLESSSTTSASPQWSHTAG